MCSAGTVMNGHDPVQPHFREKPMMRALCPRGQSGLKETPSQHQADTSVARVGKEASVGVFGSIVFCKADATVTSPAPKGDVGGVCSYCPPTESGAAMRVGTKVHGATGLGHWPLGVGLARGPRVVSPP